MPASDPSIHRFFHKKETADDFLAERVAELRASLAGRDPAELAANTASDYLVDEDGKQQFSLKVWGRQVQVAYPAFTATELGDGDQEGGEDATDDQKVVRELDTFRSALLAYYFDTADGTPAADRWISFSELPDGRFYSQAFHGYTGVKLSAEFGNDVDALGKAAHSLGGMAVTFADRAFRFQVLPYVPLMVACWLGDEDFPTSYRILFDAAAGHHLTTDACAIVGSMLTRRLIGAREEG